jgi:dynein heavy chain
MEDRHANEKLVIEKTLKDQKLDFELTIENLAKDIRSVDAYTDLRHYNNNLSLLIDFEKNVKEALAKMETINDHEMKLLGVSTNFEKLKQVRDEFAPNYRLWTTIYNFMEAFKGLKNAKIPSVDIAYYESLINLNFKEATILKTLIPEEKLTRKALNDLDIELEELKQDFMPVLEVICNDGLQDRHWDTIQEIIGENFNFKEISVGKIIAKGAYKYMGQIQEVSDQATKEFRLERMLAKIEKEWDGKKFTLLGWKNGEIPILQGQSVEDIQMLLDDNVIKAQTIRSNPSVGFMADKAKQWEELLIFMQEVLEIWIKVQTNFLYLEPVFSSEDIRLHLPAESTAF